MLNQCAKLFFNIMVLFCDLKLFVLDELCVKFLSVIFLRYAMFPLFAGCFTKFLVDTSLEMCSPIEELLHFTYYK